jgi:hypothetical protein
MAAGVARGQQVLYPDPLGSNPSDGQGTTGINPVVRERGRKGLLFHFKFQDGPNNFDSNTGFPLDMTTATVTIQIGANPPLTCLLGNNPAATTCSYAVVDGPDADGALDTVRILYNGDFPANTTIQYAVSGAKSTPFPAVSQNNDPHIVTFKTGNVAPRAPVSVELVFDISGSMALPAVPQGMVSRMQTLKDSTQTFFTMLNAHAMLGDKLGTVFFSTTATPFSPGGVTNLLPAHDPQQVALVAGQVSAQGPTAATSIGDGVLKANTAGFAPDPIPNATKYILLFSDGEQNTPPCVGQPNTSPCNSTLGTTLQVNGAAYPADIHVCTVTAGRMSAPGYVLQDKISSISCPNRH